MILTYKIVSPTNDFPDLELSTEIGCYISDKIGDKADLEFYFELDKTETENKSVFKDLSRLNKDGIIGHGRKS